MTILRIESLAYGVEDVEAGIRYFEDWGVPLVERGAKGAEFRLPSGQSIRVLQASDKSLPDSVQSGSTLRELVWGVDSARSLKAIGAELERDREVAAGTDGTLRARDESGFAIGFRRAAPAKAAGKKASSRMNRPFDPERRARPRRMGHVVYCVLKTDLDKA